jgi:hypothetical protein
MLKYSLLRDAVGCHLMSHLPVLVHQAVVSVLGSQVVSGPKNTSYFNPFLFIRGLSCPSCI